MKLRLRRSAIQVQKCYAAVEITNFIHRHNGLYPGQSEVWIAGNPKKSFRSKKCSTYLHHLTDL